MSGVGTVPFLAVTQSDHEIPPSFKKQRLTSLERILPNELILHIFSFLSKLDLGCASCVCTKWREMATHQFGGVNQVIKAQFPSVKILDKHVWNRTCLSSEFFVGNEPPLHSDDIFILKKISQTWDVKGDSGITILTMPEGLDFELLAKMGASSGKPVEFISYCKNAIEEIKKLKVHHTYRIVIANDILAKTENFTSFIEQVKYLEQSDSTVARILEIGALAVLTYVHSQNATYLFSQSYARCPEFADSEDSQFIMGNFTQDSLFFQTDDIEACIRFGVCATIRL